MAVTPVLATLHLADLFRDPRMVLPTKRDWAKIPQILAGTWPTLLPPREVVTPSDSGGALDFLQAARGADYLVVDTEYVRGSGQLLQIGLGARRGSEFVGLQILDWPSWASWFHLAIGDEVRLLVRETPVVFQNTMADVPVLHTALGVEYTDYRRIDDTMLLHAVLWSELPHDLGFLASLYSPYPATKHLPLEDPAYNWGDVCHADAVWAALRAEGKADPAAWSIYETQSLRLIPVVLESNRRGIRVDAERVQTASEGYAAKLDAARQLATAYCGWPLNPGSDDQMSLWLYRVEGLPVQKHKKTRRPTIDEDAVATLRGRYAPLPDADHEREHGVSVEYIQQRIIDGAHPLLEARVLYSGALQMDSHYLRPARRGLELDGRIYPQTKIHAQASGRHSITDPSAEDKNAPPGAPMQQIPSDLRDIVCLDPGEAWISWDWSNIETWLLGVLAGDERILQAKVAGWDTHVVNYCDIFGSPYPPDLRDPHGSPECAAWREQLHWQGGDDVRRVFAKRFVYRLHYRGNPKHAMDIPGAHVLGLNAARLVQASQRYLAQHPAIVEFWRRTDEEVRREGLTRTFMGRPRRLLGMGDARLREGTNHKLQGGVADILNLTLVAIRAAFPDSRVVYTAHDAAKIGVPLGDVEAYLPIVRGIVERTWEIAGRPVQFPAKFSIRRGV